MAQTSDPPAPRGSSREETDTTEIEREVVHLRGKYDIVRRGQATRNDPPAASDALLFGSGTDTPTWPLPALTQRMSLIWNHRVDGLIGGAFFEICGDVAVVQFWRRTQGRGITALDVATGRTAWTSSAEGIENFFSYQDRLYIGGARARCFSIETGALVAELPGAEAIVRPPVAEGPVFFLVEHGVLVILNPETLEPVWQFADPSEEWELHNDFLCRRGPSEITVHDRFTRAHLARIAVPATPHVALHAHCGDLWCEFGISSGGRRAFDLTTGRIAWRAETPVGYDLPAFGPTIAYAAADGATAFDLRTGSIVWQQPLESPSPRITTGAVHLQNGAVFLGTGRAVYELDAASGDIRRRLEVDFEPQAVRPLDGGRLLVASEDTLFCFGPS